MALTNQPYLPLYVDDWMNNTKLKMCTPAAHGVMISIMCIMHKEPTYGKILLKQKFKQSDKQIKNFALQIAKVTAFDLLEIENPLSELISVKVLKIQDDFLICNRMVKDAEISEARAKAGKNGGKSNKEKNFAYTKPEAKEEAKPQPNNQAKSEANSVIVNGIVNESENVVGKGKEGMGEKPKIVEPEIEIIIPFNTETFKAQWQLWKSYKNKEHGFKFKSAISEQANLKKLSEMAGNDEKTAIAIVHQSIANGWKGFFELKNNVNGKQKSSSESRVEYSDDFKRKIAERLQS